MTTSLLESTIPPGGGGEPTATLGDHATFITSKNAGPFLITVDAIFSSRESFERIRDADIVTPERIAALYQRDVSDVLGIYFFGPANALKVTMRRPVPSGAPGDTDVYGAQQHVPMMSLPVPIAAPTTPAPVHEGNDS
jgi:hypothetical protein